MTDRFPAGRCGLREFLQIAEITKNTFFLRYRNNPAYKVLLDIREDRRHRIHMPRSAAEHIAQERAKKPAHGNKGRKPRQRCVACGSDMHPRQAACPACGATTAERESMIRDLLAEGPERLSEAAGVLPGTALRRYRRVIKGAVTEQNGSIPTR